MPYSLSWRICPPGPRDGHHALAGSNPRGQSVQRRAMTRAPKEKGGVGGERERRTFQLVKIEIHTHTQVLREALPRAQQTGDLSTRQPSVGHYNRSGDLLHAAAQVLLGHHRCLRGRSIAWGVPNP